MTGTVHIIGAGLAGLSAATELAARGRHVVLYEAALAAGGRCRSFDDRETGLTIDNGNHLLLSGNRAALGYLRRIGSADLLAGPEEASFPFVDAGSGERWVLRPNRGPVPWWLTRPDRRVPGSRARDYFGIARLFAKAKDQAVGSSLGGNALLDERLWRPVLLAALNTDPQEAAAGLAARIVRETLAAGGAACRPLVASRGLSATFIDPALRFLRGRGAEIHLRSRLLGLECEDETVRTLAFEAGARRLDPGDRVVLAVPPWAATALLPGIAVPTEFRAILNMHFAVPPPADQPLIMGIVNGTAEWLFAFADRLSVTISNADRYMAKPQEELAGHIWAEVARLTGLQQQALPRWRVVKEKRATFAATPEQARRRPPAVTACRNLVLAGDWVETGLPATIEGAIRSGHAAAAALAAQPMGFGAQTLKPRGGTIAAG